MSESDFETHGRVFEEEVPIDRVLALHGSISVSKDDLGKCCYSSVFLSFSRAPCFPWLGQIG